jgi:hypothetical protein
MPNKLIDLTAKKINQLTVVRRVENKGIKTMWLCVCDCGNELIVAANHLNCNTCKTISCKDCCSKRKVKHRSRWRYKAHE